MHKFLFSELEDTPTVIDYLEVQSYEMNVYLVYLTVKDRSGMVYDKKVSPCDSLVQAIFVRLLHTVVLRNL